MKTKVFLLLTTLLVSFGGIQAQNWQETQLLLPEANSPSSFFGEDVSVDGDYAVVGAIELWVDNGYAIVFQRNGGNWEKVAKLTMSNPTGYAEFGGSVSISGDVVIVGSLVNCAYIFEKPASGWTDMTETAKLTASDGFTLDAFGQSVSISGDVAIVGAPGDDDNGLNSGSAYVFKKPAAGWIDMTETGKLKADDGAEDDRFGGSVSISGDAAIVGAPGDDDNGNASGSAYIFQKPAAGWGNMNQTGKLRPFDGDAEDNFASSVNISGDVAIVGAPGDNDNGTNSGSAYIFQKPAVWGNMNETAKLTASDGASNDEFGWSVGISGNTAIVSALKDDDNGTNSGSAYIFEKSGTNWATMTENQKLKADDGADEDKFAYSMGISGNYAIIGAYGNDDNGEESGSAYIFKNTAAGLDAFSTHKLSVYPNPAKRLINIECPQNNIQKLRITDISGKEMLSKTKPQQKEQIDLSGFGSGIYLIHIQTTHKSFTRKIIKE